MSDSSIHPMERRQAITLLVLVVLIAVLLGVFLSRIKWRSEPKVPQVVTEFLASYLVDARVEPDALAEYLENPNDETAIEFAKVFVGYNQGYDTYEVECISDNFSLIRLQLSGELQPPPIGFWYDLSPDGEKIVEWRLTRVVPFSRYDPEYAEGW